MKMALTLITIIFINLYANENWIKITPSNQPKTSKQDVNLSQIEPINKVIKQAAIVKQLINATSKKERQTSNEKNWFSLTTEKK